MYPHLCMHVHVSADARGGQKRVSEMELQMIVRSLMWVLGTREISLQVQQVLSISESSLLSLFKGIQTFSNTAERQWKFPLRHELNRILLSTTERKS